MALGSQSKRLSPAIERRREGTMSCKRETAMNGMRMFRVVTRIMPLWALVSIVSGNSSYGQQITPPLSRSTIPTHHRYMHFLRYQMYLDNRADLLDHQGQNAQATVLRTHLQHDLQFTDAQMAVLRTAGLQMKSDLAGIQAQAMPIVSQDRQWLKANGRKTGPPP